MPAGGAASSRARVPAARSGAYVTLLTSSATASMVSRFAARSSMRSTKLFFDSSLSPLGPKITAVIFGPKGESELSKKSFVDLMLDLAAKRETIEAVADEVNSVTYAPDLAAGTRALLEAAPPAGIYHVT